jgi:hypothetical protein
LFELRNPKKIKKKRRRSSNIFNVKRSVLV